MYLLGDGKHPWLRYCVQNYEKQSKESNSFFNAIVLNVWSKEYLIQTKIELLKNTMDLLPWNQNLRGIQDPTMINYI